MDVVGQLKSLTDAVTALQRANIPCSLFIEPETAAIDATLKSGAQMVEFHTGRYSEVLGHEQIKELARISDACAYAHAKGIAPHAGHGLNYRNVTPIAAIPHMQDLNIGHSVVARAVLVGLERAVREMKELIRRS